MRKLRKPRRATVWVVVGVSALAVAGCSDGSADRRAGRDSRPPAPASAAPTPTWAAVTGPPRTISSVRSFKAADGIGWRPHRGARVVVRDDDGAGASPIADEARLLAGELGGLPVVMAKGGKEEVRPGDIELRLTGGARARALPDNAPVHDTADEAYRLTVRDTRLTLTAPTDAGLFNGTRTLLQSVRASGGVPEGTIEDRPDRPQRGLNLDIARKHFSAAWIEDRVREMADLKLNQLQLHFSDDQAFRIESSSHPRVVSREHLTKDEVRRLVTFARARHITVIPELDSPGHLGAVLRAYPELRLRGAGGAPERGAIDISEPRAAEVVDDLLREYADLFPGPYWHLGGDEYRALTARNPEATYPKLAQAARKKYGPRARVKDLATGWLNDRARTVREATGGAAGGAAGRPEGKAEPRRIKAWNDGYFRGGVVAADRDREVEYWTGKEIGAREPREYLEEGRKLVNINDEYLYYVLGEPNDFRYPTGERIYKEWTPAVLRGSDPVPASLSGPDKVLGARFAVWCDFASAQSAREVADGIRMPLRALAQKVWNPSEPTLSWKDFGRLADRLDAEQDGGDARKR